MCIILICHSYSGGFIYFQLAGNAYTFSIFSHIYAVGYWMFLKEAIVVSYTCHFTDTYTWDANVGNF